MPKARARAQPKGGGRGGNRRPALTTIAPLDAGRRTIEFYPEIRLAHIAAVAASGALFFVRGLANAASAGWARATPLRYLSYTIDTVLLTTALTLATILRQYPFRQSWLTVNVVLLIVYITLGFAAFWRARTRAARLALWLAALAVYGFMITVARARHPLGLFFALGT